MVRFNPFYSREIISLFENGMKASDFAGDITAALELLFPSKKAYFEGRDRKRLSVYFNPAGPFGPEPDRLADLLLPDLEGEAAAVMERFGLTGISLHGINAGKIQGPENVTVSSAGDWLDASRRPRSGLALTALEFKRLSVLAREGRILDRVVLSVFIDPEKVFSYYVPSEATLESIIRERGEPGDFKVPGDPYDPMTGRPLDPSSDRAGEGSSLVAFAGSGYLLSPATGGILGFPWFGRTLSMKRGKGSPPEEYPCSNCSECVRSCPSGIEPAYLYHLVRAGEDEEALSLGLEKCVRCGICSIVCPSGIGLYEGITESLERIEAQLEEEAG